MQLKRLLEHAVKHVPFYSDIKLASGDPFKNLERFPIIEKGIIKRDITKFKANNILEKNMYYVATGGSSGNPFEFYLDNSTFGKEWAFVVISWNRVGFTPGDKVVSFRGVEFKNASKCIYWQDNPIYNMLEMSPFHMSEGNLQRYVGKIKEFKPRYIHGYPSAISILAKYVIAKGIENFPHIEAVLAVSENIYPQQKEIIEKAFNTRVFSFYGQSERVIMAPECEYDTRYHSFPEYGITEIVDKDGNAVGEGEGGELVGTGFISHGMPFIRYRVGDYAVLGGSNCKCGRNHIMLEDLMGQCSKEMMVVGKSGALFAIHALYFTIHSDVFRNVYCVQFHQKRAGEIILNVVPQSGFSEGDRKRISGAIYRRVGDDLQLFIEEVDNIELTPRGKSKLIIQDLKVE